MMLRKKETNENITRLLKGEESRLWGRRGAVPPAEVMKMDDAAQKRDERDEK
jgi:glycerol-3-phosphate acyltransferase PlsY